MNTYTKKPVKHSSTVTAKHTLTFIDSATHGNTVTWPYVPERRQYPTQTAAGVRHEEHWPAVGG